MVVSEIHHKGPGRRPGRVLEGGIQREGTFGSKPKVPSLSHYAPNLARFTTTDPIQDGANWYAYVNQDPVNLVDPNGLDPNSYVPSLSSPIPGAKITDTFAYNPVTQTGHQGLDYGAVTGTKVLAAASGIVSAVGYDKDGYGYWIIIDHGNDYFTGYAHLSDNTIVNIGDIVDQGDEIALSGSSGGFAKNAQHLHFVFWQGNVMNPPQLDSSNYFSKVQLNNLRNPSNYMK